MAAKERADLGFDAVFDETSPSDWQPKQDRSIEPVPREAIAQVAEASGFSSREPGREGDTTKPGKRALPKEPTDQINFRAKVSTINDFRALCNRMQPPWPFGYGFERAIAALKHELEAEKPSMDQR